jgi:hypothetical protein
MQGKLLTCCGKLSLPRRVLLVLSIVMIEGAWGPAVLEAGRQSGISIIAVTGENSAGEEQCRHAFETIVSQSAEAFMFSGLFHNSGRLNSSAIVADWPNTSFRCRSASG